MDGQFLEQVHPLMRKLYSKIDNWKVHEGKLYKRSCVGVGLGSFDLEFVCMPLPVSVSSLAP